MELYLYMATYAIGDVQGCFSALERLLIKIGFNRNKDTLWFVGDIINRGPESLKTIKFIRSLGNNAICVLGNHELHLLACGFGVRKQSDKDTLSDILESPHKSALLDWLRHCPLAHYDSHYQALLVHAGVPPQWDLNTTLACAQELSDALTHADPRLILTHLFTEKTKQLLVKKIKLMRKRMSFF